jgi:hypothetical protein
MHLCTYSRFIVPPWHFLVSAVSLCGGFAVFIQVMIDVGVLVSKSSRAMIGASADDFLQSALWFDELEVLSVL